MTDLYPDNLPQGKIWTRITNNGPAVLVNAPVELKCGGSGKPVANQNPWSHVEAPTVINISLKPGETVAVPTNVLVDTNQYNYDLWCAAWPKSFTESNDSNNKYSEKLAGSGGPQPQPPAPPGGGSSGVTTADLAVTDLYPDNMPVGEVFARITNNGPSSVSNVGVQLGCSAVRTEYVGGAKSTHALAPGTTNITLSPGQTAAFDTNIRIEDSTKYWYKVTCTVQVPFKDPNPSNNSYTESIPPSP